MAEIFFKEKYGLYFGQSNISIAFSKDLKKWTKQKEPVLKPRPGFFDSGELKAISAQKTPGGILLFYDASIKETQGFKLQIGAALFSLENPRNVIWRSNTALYERAIKTDCLIAKGVVAIKNQFCSYWSTGDTEVMMMPFFNSVYEEANRAGEKLKRHNNNPIISPVSQDWHAGGTFNPAALLLHGDIHLIYRIVGTDGVSRLGFAKTKNGSAIHEIYPKPVFSLDAPRADIPDSEKKYSFSLYPSGGSWGGAEDPRIANIDGTIYVTFNSFSGWDSIRVSLISIDEKDFKNQKWKWQGPIMLSPKREVHKNWVLFPEKINGKFAVLHSISPHVQIDYVDHLEDLSSGKKKIKSVWVSGGGPKHGWDTHMRGVGPTPIKTKDGWLIFYHATNKVRTGGYALGAMLLDLKHPEKIIARSSSPILLLDMLIENYCSQSFADFAS